MILRLSQKLNKKIKAGKIGEMPLDENPFADWSCHLFTAGRTQYIIMSNTKTLYSCLMRGNGITNDGQFAALALSTISEFMAEDGYQEAFEKFVAPNCNAINFGKSLNRSVTGSMNDLINHATICLTELGMSPLQVGFKLNGVLLSALATEEFQGYGKPNEAFCRLVVQQVND